MLEVEGLSVHYGAVPAVREVSLRVRPGETVAILGPNGAGKSSTLRGLMGLAPSRGRVVLGGEDVSRLSTEDRVRRGMTLCPEGRHVFAGLSVAENLRLGAAARRDRSGVRSDLEQMHAIFPVLAERSRQLAGTLSGGEQQMLAIARALMSRPRLLLLDEPSLGLAPLIVRRIFELIAAVKAARDLTILVVEQNATAVLAAADRAYALVGGRVRHEGRAADLRSDRAMIDLYLGGR